MSLLDQNWGAGGTVDDEAQDENQPGRQVDARDLSPPPPLLLRITPRSLERLSPRVTVH